MARLARCAYAVVWVNPLKGHPGLRAARRRDARRASVRRPVPARAQSGESRRPGRRARRHREEACGMKEILGEVERWREQGEKVVVATVVATRRSAPRPVGTSLAVSESGKMCGSVSGGCVESDVYENAREVMESGRAEAAQLRDQGRGGLGGRAALRRRDRRFRGAHGVIERLAELARSGERAVLFTVVEGDGAGGKRARRRGWRAPRRRRAGRGGRAVRRADPRAAATGCSSSATARRCSPSGTAPPPRLLVYGAVDTAEALVRAAKLLGWTAIVADARAKFATAERIPSADELIVEWPDEALGAGRARPRRPRSSSSPTTTSSTSPR